MRKQLLVFLLVLLAGSASAEAFYEVDVGQDSYEVNSTVRTYCDNGPGDDGCPVSGWTLTLRKPADSEILSVVSSAGEVKDYESYGDKVVVKTSHEEPTESETVRIRYRVNESAEEIVEGLYTRSISLPAFSGDENSGSFTVENLISADVDSNASQSITGESFSYEGSGPLRARIVFGNGSTTDHYEFFPERRNGSFAYSVAAGTLGQPSRSRIAVGVMDSGVYNETVNSWSAGQYFKGSIVLRNNSNTGFTPILAHETVHAVNEQKLDWNTDSSWFDEGVAKHVEYLARKADENSDARTRNLFGDPVTYVDREDGLRYRLGSKGVKENLWRYYSENRSFMKYWNSQSSNRDFGYAYSELVVKKYVVDGGNLRELYREIEGSSVKTDEQKWEFMSNHMDLTPCKFEEREKFNSCIEEVNSYDFKVYRAVPSPESSELQVKELEVPNRSGPEPRLLNSTSSGSKFFETILEWLSSLFS
jgi:hypothetical protein